MDSNEATADASVDSPAAKDVRAWLDRNGYRLELRIARSLLTLGPAVEQGGQYLDAASDRLREFDVRASWGILNQRRDYHSLNVVVECKNTQAPWILFVGGVDWTWGSTLPGDGIEPACEVCVDVGEGVVAEAVRNIEDWGYALTEKRNPGKGSSVDHAREAVLSAASATCSMTESVRKLSDPYFEDGPPKGYHYNVQYIPVVVTTSPIFACALDGRGEITLREVNIARVAARPYPDSEMVPVVVARPEAFDGFIKRVISDASTAAGSGWGRV